jgi:hypothetical protein
MVFGSSGSSRLQGRLVLSGGELHMDQPDAGDALTRLEPFVGEWALEVTSPSGERLPGDGRCRFTWLESRAHLLQHSTIDLAEAPDAFCIIGCDAANGTYTQLYSDERGVCRIYQMSFEQNDSSKTNGRFDEKGGRSRSGSSQPSATIGTRSRVDGRRRRMAAPSRPTST